MSERFADNAARRAHEQNTDPASSCYCHVEAEVLRSGIDAVFRDRVAELQLEDCEREAGDPSTPQRCLHLAQAHLCGIGRGAATQSAVCAPRGSLSKRLRVACCLTSSSRCRRLTACIEVALKVLIYASVAPPVNSLVNAGTDFWLDGRSDLKKVHPMCSGKH